MIYYDRSYLGVGLVSACNRRISEANMDFWGFEGRYQHELPGEGFWLFDAPSPTLSPGTLSAPMVDGTQPAAPPLNIASAGEQRPEGSDPTGETSQGTGPAAAPGAPAGGTQAPAPAA